MKKKDDILRRAVCLLTFSDRCALEEKVTNGVRHSLNEREQQREIIMKWLNEKNYYNFLTPIEKQAIETQVINKKNIEIYNFENEYECIEPLLWSVGLVGELHNYDEFVLDDLHIPLKIGREHTLEDLESCCKYVPDDIIKKNREIAMLWYWRCLEGRKNIGHSINYLNIIKKIFGDNHMQMLEDYKYFDTNKGDFIIKGKLVSELTKMEIVKLEVIAEKRFYAFEWLCTDDDWDSIDLVC